MSALRRSLLFFCIALTTSCLTAQSHSISPQAKSFDPTLINNLLGAVPLNYHHASNQAESFNLNEFYQTLKETNKNLNTLFKFLDKTNKAVANFGEFVSDQTNHLPVELATNFIAELGDRSPMLRLKSARFNDFSDNDASLIDVNQMKLLYQLVDMFDMAKLLHNDMNRNVMLSLLERFQIPRENIRTIETLVNLSRKLRRERDGDGGAKLKPDRPADDVLFSKFKQLIGRQTVSRGILNDDVDGGGRSAQSESLAKLDEKSKLMEAAANSEKSPSISSKTLERLLIKKENKQKKKILPTESTPSTTATSTLSHVEESSPKTTSTPNAIEVPVRLSSSSSEAATDPVNRLLKLITSEELVKQYSWIYKLFGQLKPMKKSQLIDLTSQLAQKIEE